MSTEATGTTSGWPRWTKIVLVGSLALNLLFVGGFASAVWRHRHGHGGFGGPGGRDNSLMGFVRQLPADRQQVVRDQVTAARETVKPLRKEIRDAWMVTNTVLTAEPFDKAKVKEAAARLLAAEAKFKTAVSDALADTAEKLTLEERRKLQEWREHRRGGHHKWRGPGGGEAD